MLDILKEPRWLFGLDGINVPQWFIGYDSYLQLVFFVVTLFISICAFKIYKSSDKRTSYLFGIGFIFISVSYLIWAILNLAVISHLGAELCLKFRLCFINLLVDLTIYIHMFFFIIGLATLTYATLKIKKWPLYALLITIISLVLLFSQKTLFFFYLISSVLLLYLFFHQLRSYFKYKKAKVLMVGISFLLLFFGSLEFLFGVTNALDYTIGTLLVLIAYLIILVNIILIIKE